MRLRSIDLLRAIAILIMIAVHFVENLAGTVPAIAGLGAPTFIFLSGTSYHIWLCAQRRRRTPEVEITRRTLRRALFLFVVGLLFNVLVWLPEDIFNWDILTLIATGYLVLAGARHLDTHVLLIPCALVLAVTPVAQAACDWKQYWQGPYFDHDWSFVDVSLGYLIVGYFPLLPWIAVPVLGFAAGRWLFPEGRACEATARRLVALGLGVMSVALGLAVVGARSAILRESGFLAGWRVTLPSLEYLVGVLGAIALALGLATLRLDVGDRALAQGRWSSVVALWSRSSLTVYLLHHVAHVWPLWLAGLWRNGEATALWRKALDVPRALALGGVFVLVAHAALRALERRGGGVEGWMRAFADGARRVSAS